MRAPRRMKLSPLRLLSLIVVLLVTKAYAQGASIRNGNTVPDSIDNGEAYGRRRQVEDSAQQADDGEETTSSGGQSYYRVIEFSKPDTQPIKGNVYPQDEERRKFLEWLGNQASEAQKGQIDIDPMTGLPANQAQVDLVKKWEESVKNRDSDSTALSTVPGVGRELAVVRDDSDDVVILLNNKPISLDDYQQLRRAEKIIQMHSRSSEGNAYAIALGITWALIGCAAVFLGTIYAVRHGYVGQSGKKPGA